MSAHSEIQAPLGNEIERLRAECEHLRFQNEQLRLQALHHSRDRMVQETFEEALRGFAQGILAASGEATFTLLARSMARTLAVDYAFICELVEPDRTHARSLALIAHGESRPAAEYELANTPCEHVVGKVACLYPSGLQRLFPEAAAIAEWGIESYMAVPLFDAAGEPIGHVGVLHTGALTNTGYTESVLQIVARAATTELLRKRAEAEVLRRAVELEQANEQLRRYGEEMEALVVQRSRELVAEKSLLDRLIDSLPAAAFFLDRDLIFRRVNAACGALWGGDPAAILGRHVHSVFPSTWETGSLIEHVRETRELIRLEAHAYVLAGRQTYVDVTYAPVLDDRGELEGILLFVLDVTAKVENQRMQSEQIQRLKELDRLKGDFVNSASHELRTPLTSITGYAEFLEDEVAGPLTEGQADFVAQIQASSRRLQRIVDDMLDFARLEAGTFQLVLREGDLTQLVREEVGSLLPQASGARVTLNERMPEGPIQVRMDGDRIGQVVLNLVGNAIKFTAAGGRIDVWLEEGPEEVRVFVRDTGIGIAPEHQARLFDKFYQVDASTTREHGGAGLGLSISRALVEAHGGTLAVESVQGEGSTFSFSLPLSDG